MIKPPRTLDSQDILNGENMKNRFFLIIFIYVFIFSSCESKIYMENESLKSNTVKTDVNDIDDIDFDQQKLDTNESYITDKSIVSTSENVNSNKTDFSNIDSIISNQRMYDIEEFSFYEMIENSYDLDRANLKIDNGYKMFYGCWEITDIIEYAAKFPLEDDTIIGKLYYFSEYRSISYYDNKYTVVDYPTYEIRIIPFTDDDSYFGELLPGIKSFGLSGTYFTVFQIWNDWPLVFPCQVIIVDDDNMVICYDYLGGSAYVKLERIAHTRYYTAHYKAL
jgi:hypothetical protein